MRTSSILVLDARQDISEQDAHMAGFILEAGRALVVAVNKWERLPAAERDHVKRVLARKLDFLSFARLHFISALEGRGIGAADEVGGRGVCGRHGAAAHAPAHPGAGRRRPAAGAAARGVRAAPSCATRTRAGRTRRASSCTAPAWTTCPRPIAATWNDSSARLSNCRARRCASSSEAGRIPTRQGPAGDGKPMA